MFILSYYYGSLKGLLNVKRSLGEENGSIIRYQKNTIGCAPRRVSGKPTGSLQNLKTACSLQKKTFRHRIIKSNFDTLWLRAGSIFQKSIMIS